MAPELRILGRGKRLFYNKLKIMYTIEDLRNGKCAVINDGSWDQLRKVLLLAFPKDTAQTLGNFPYYIKHYDNNSLWYGCDEVDLPKQSVKLFLNQINKQMRKITWQQAHRIIDIACPKWRQKLAEQWAINIVFGQHIEISPEFYKEMRQACTKEQHKLFDEIFGKDINECPYKDGDPVWVRDREDQTWLFRYSTGKFENERIQGYESQKKAGIYSVWNLHMPFDPDNLPVNE